MMIFSCPSYFPLIHCPGALPLALGRTTAPVITSACLRLFGDIFMPRDAKRRSRPTISSGSRSQLQAQRVGYCFAGEVVFGRSQSAHEDHNVCARQGQDRRSREMFAAVSYDGLEDDIDTELVKFLREIEGVCVLAKRGQQFTMPRLAYWFSAFTAKSVNETTEHTGDT